ncbi:MAG TPA: 6-bladed beta-propeller [Solirubrobacterales bacterium]|nr:6-bladed beta-propeller [Solirubrobacterales bacterium]
MAFIVLCICSAVPVLAAERPGGPAEEIVHPPAPEDFDPSRLPAAQDVTQALEQAEDEEDERKAWLASPEAAQEREHSRFAFAGLGRDDAEDLLRTVFGEELTQLNRDPARFLSDAQLLSTSEPTSATVKDAGNGMLLESSLPVQAEDEEGELRKVDLSLEESGSGFETDNALVEVEIPDEAGQPIKVGDDGVAIELAGADEGRPNQLFGDENVFAPAVLPDTDMLISPIATGVEVFNVLRSENSPETLRYQVQMPAGAELRANGEWGAEVVKGNEVLSTVPEPIAVDAQGTDVPVDLQVDGNSLVLTVDHREGDYAMPILLDPILENDENWIYGQNHNALDMGVWGFNKNVAGMYGSTYCIYECFGPGGSSTRGLYVSSQPGTYWPNQFAQWSYAAPNINSYISSATLGAPYVHADHGCPESSYPKPHNYFGIWSANQNNWVYLSVNSANQPGSTYTLNFSGDSVIFGLSSGGAEYSIGCWRDLYAGGAHVWLDDWNPPWIQGGLSGIQGRPSGWVSNATPFTITAVAKDEGLGIKNVRIHQWNGPINYDIPPQNECAGTRRSPCYTTHTASFDNLTGGDFFQGERDVWLSANDPTGKYTADYHWTMRVDNEPPEMALSGQLAEATSEVGSAEVPAGKGDQLSLPVYNLTIAAKDGNANDPLNKRSGVKDIEVYLDNPTAPGSWVEQTVPWSPQSCVGPNYSCEMNKTFSLQLSKAVTTSGKHKLKVEAVDQVGKRLKREIEFEYFPATGMKDEYVMHYFPLPDGSGNEAEEEHPDRPELAVNVMNGNLVYREQDIEVEGAGADLEVERYYNSMLPENEDTEWGDGWTLAQTPDLDPIKPEGSPVASEAEILDSSGAFEEEVELPTTAGAEKFDPALQATLTKKSTGGYELTDETGESATSVAFDATGQTEALLTEGSAKVDFDYEGGELAEIEVEDPATFAADPSELQIPEPQLITLPKYASSFGSNGSANGQLKSPGDVAVDPQGNLWVVDKSNNRIQKFDQAGNFLAKFGSLGAGDGQFNRPTSIALAANGDLLVTDAGNARVQRFNSLGVFVSKFGSSGTGNGQFTGSGPEGVAVDGSGNIWVADTYGGRLQKFSSAGAFLQSVGTKGSGTGQLGEPTGIDIAPNGDIWVADWQNHRVSKFSSAGTFISSFGSNGSGDGQFKNPDEIEIDKLGNVWVGDQSNNRIQQFDLTGQFKGKFGTAGSGQGQFSFSYPMGIAADSKGHLWIADVNNHRIQQWMVPIERPAYFSAFGSNGSTDGKLQAPADVAVGVEGNLWVVDKSNNRIQKFDPTGKYLAKFGSLGAGDGQFNRPTAIAVDRDGNLLVTDSSNNRVQKFSPEGQFLSKFGSAGSGNGQFSAPEGIATDFEGNIWVADSGNGRIQQFSESGEFIKVVSSKGSGSGHLGKPIGIDVDPDGNIWVGDLQNNRIAVFEPDGDFVSQFGSLGSGPGQFNRPSGVDIDSKGNVWVTDQSNQRVQRFDLAGSYIGQFGSLGSGEGQFSFPTINTPTGIESDGKGGILIGDVNNHRIQRWQLGHYETPASAPLDLSDGDPKVEVATPGGLVTIVTGNAAGEHTYTYEGDFLTSHQGPEGKTTYKKNTAGLLSEVILPNGTWAKIYYYADNRVEKVTVAPNGLNEKSTFFYYEQGPPRRSRVAPPNQPQITYDIGADGSVFKWWHAGTKPEILGLNGSLGLDKAGKEVPAGDLFLEVIGDSPHGITSIQVLANGDRLVSEKRCDKEPATSCPTREEDLWATDTASLSPGVLNLEVIVTNGLELSESKRWSVTIPQTPPPVPGAPVAPKFSEIQKFREDYGLEVVFPVENERKLVERIYGLINAWHSPGTPAGEVARASWERWGVPLRPEDVAEMEYRESYMNRNIPLVEEWAQAHRPSTFAGYYMDHRSGGIMHVGFTSDQEGALAELKQQVSLEAADRLATYPVTPTAPRVSLESLLSNVEALWDSDPALAGTIVSTGVSEGANAVEVAGTDVSLIENHLKSALGQGAALKVVYEDQGLEFAGRNHSTGRIHAGDRLIGQKAGGYTACTAGFGAWDRIGTKANGEPEFASFALTAGHCAPLGRLFYRQDAGGAVDPSALKKIGHSARTGLPLGGQEYETDGSAIALNAGGLMPYYIFLNEMLPKPVGDAFAPKAGETLCFSGVATNERKCGEFIGVRRRNAGNPGKQLYLITRFAGVPGDSGSPVWSPRTGGAVGLLSGGPGVVGLVKDWVTPLVVPRRQEPSKVPGILNAPGMASLHLAIPGE